MIPFYTRLSLPGHRRLLSLGGRFEMFSLHLSDIPGLYGPCVPQETKRVCGHRLLLQAVGIIAPADAVISVSF